MGIVDILFSKTIVSESTVDKNGVPDNLNPIKTIYSPRDGFISGFEECVNEQGVKKSEEFVINQLRLRREIADECKYRIEEKIHELLEYFRAGPFDANFYAKSTTKKILEIIRGKS